jgi:hypothetical protein
VHESEAVGYYRKSDVPNDYRQTCTLWTNVHFMDKKCALWTKMSFYGQNGRFMDKRVIYAQKVLLLGFIRKINISHWGVQLVYCNLFPEKPFYDDQAAGHR